jgi:hypothetical protein
MKMGELSGLMEVDNPNQAVDTQARMMVVVTIQRQGE